VHGFGRWFVTVVGWLGDAIIEAQSSVHGASTFAELKREGVGSTLNLDAGEKVSGKGEERKE
jgi:hypothetical protein